MDSRVEVARKLVTVRRISNVLPIVNTHFNIVMVDGWRVVVRSMDNFREGQLVVYLEIDSFLPNTSYFWEYCARSSAKMDGEIGYLVRTVMKGKHISQGLIFPLETFSEITEIFNQLKNKHSNVEAVNKLMDMSFEKELGVKKWENPQGKRDHVLGRAPVFFPQPGCTRAQNMTDLFERYGQIPFQITEKLDGYPMTIYCIQKGSQWNSSLPPLPEHQQQDGPMRIGICNRPDDLMDHKDSWFWTTAKDQGMLNKIRELGNEIRNVAIQGELCGSSIYTNSMGFAPGKHHFYAFDIFDIDRQKYLKPHRFLDACSRLHIDHAPVIEPSTRLSDFATNVDNLIAKAEGTGLLGAPREGLIFKEVDGGRTFKAISNSWLLQTGKAQ
ncbi:hypothetical protein SLS62_004446 [Diatrype stigma]|uniref:RNA ligase domain-containing protein n=1 Tax=Diatrype stigma TaxID=117547 RepID=A0AAN9YP92_9PEZI